ncbi:hypothetical protein BH10PSE12_BH10PSE12_05170 [soil metagenome]
MRMRHSQPPIIRLNAIPQQPSRAPAKYAAARYEVGTGYRFAIGVVVILSLCYNAILAMAGAAGVGISASSVVTFEVLLLVSALLLVLRTQFGPDDTPSLALLFVSLVIMIYMSAANGVFFPDTMRNYTIIALFTMMGLRSDFKAVNTIFLTATLLVLAGLLFEMFDLAGYVNLFKPAQYFATTRGLPIPEWDKSGLFSNALGFKDRFSFGVTAHRTSSLFLEQISHANFASLLIILLLSCWRRFAWWHRLIYVGTIVMIVITTSTRTSLTLALAAPLGYFLYPYLPRFLNILIAPLFIIIAFVVGDPTVTHLMEDDFVGRVSWTASTLYRLDLGSAMGQNISMSPFFMDSGFTWVIYTGTLFGLLIFWTFVSCYVPQVTISQKRFGYALSLYVASSLLVAGTAVFSIKVAGLMWFLAGFMRKQRDDLVEPEESKSDPPVEAAAPTPPIGRKPRPGKALTT